MRKFHKIPTTYEVWSTLLRVHGDNLEVYSTISDPEGHAFGGGGDKGRMFTRWGFRRQSNCPLMEADTVYDIEWHVHAGRLVSKHLNERTLYWLCISEEDRGD